MSDRKKIALITTWFPPIQGVATNRMYSFAQYLSDEFNVEVFTISNRDSKIILNDSISVNYIKSKSWKELFKHNSRDGKWKHLFKTAAIVLLSKVSKSPLKKWKKETLERIEKSHLLSTYSCIISSYSPHETHQIASSFVKKFPDVKWIADMRDEMTKNPGAPSNLKSLYKKIEKEVSDNATALTTVSLPILNDFKKLCPSIPFYEEVRNGFNHEITPCYKRNDKFTIGYFGTFYGEIKPVYFFKALEKIVKDNSDFDFEFHVFGASSNFEVSRHLKDKVYHHVALPYLDAIKKMMSMDVNLLINPRSSRKGVYTGKLFDYLSAGRPILAFVDTDDVAAMLVNNCKIGYVAEFDDVEGNCSAIQKAYKDWVNNCQLELCEDTRLTFHRQFQVNKLKGLIHKVIA